MDGAQVLIPIIAILAFFSTLTTFIYMRYRSRHQQRMALIESGRTADIFSEKPLSASSNALKIGMLLTGAGLGFLTAVILEEYTMMDDILFFPLTLIGGGVALIMFYKTARRDESDYDRS